MRNYYFDNLKFIGIFLVVFGHTITNTSTYSEMKFVYFILSVIFAFHMPLMLFIAGFFSKSLVNKTNKVIIVGVIKKLIIPYLIVTTLFRIMYFTGSGNYNWNYFGPTYGLWFLITLATYRLFQKYYVKVSGIVIIAILLHYVGIFGEPSFLSMTRSMGLFIFYLWGYYMSKERFDQIYTYGRQKKYLLGSLIVMSSVFIYYLMDYVPVKTIYQYDRNIEDFSVSFVGYATVVTTLTIISFIFLVWIFTITPTKKYKISLWGQHTMSIYLGHLILLQVFRYVPYETHRQLVTLVSSFIICSTMIVIILGVVEIKERMLIKYKNI